jgi:hypothetical protein
MNSPEPFEGRGIRGVLNLTGRRATKEIEIHSRKKSVGPAGISRSRSKAFLISEDSRTGRSRGHLASVWNMET